MPQGGQENQSTSSVANSGVDSTGHRAFFAPYEEVRFPMRSGEDMLRPPYAKIAVVSASARQASTPSVARNIAGWSLLAATALAFVIASIVVPPRSMLRPLKAALRCVLRIFGLRIQVRGREHLAPDRTYLYLFNHTNVLDHLILLAHLDGHFVGLEAIEAARIPVYGWAARRWGQIRIDRSSPEAARRSCQIVAARLRDGTNVAACPEGRHTRDGLLGPFKKGVFHIAVESQATLVPIALVGLYPLMPHPRRLVAAGEVEIRIGVPLAPPTPSPTAHEVLAARTRAAILRSAGVIDSET